MNKWTKEEIDFLKLHYPQNGKMWCCQQLKRTESSVRVKAAQLGLRLDPNSSFFLDFQERAALSKIGKKRPDQALVIKQLHEQGKLKKTDSQKKAISEMFKKWHQTNEHPKGMLGKKHTKESLQKISQASQENFKKMSEDEKYEKVKKMIETKTKNGTLAPNRHKTTWKGGWREIGGKRKFFRSRWEANYARFLEWLKTQGKIKEWQHEPKTFWFEGIKRGCVSYLPDFWVEELDGSDSFHEVKGWMDDRSKTKIKRMAKYYPNVKLIVISSKEYKTIEDNFSSMIVEWETK